MRSIRSRTLVLVLTLLAVSMTLLAYKGYRDARHEIEELFDAQLAQSARLVLGLVTHDVDGVERAVLQRVLDDAASSARDGRPGHHYERRLMFQLVDGAGATLLESASAPAGLLTSLLQQAGRPEGMPVGQALNELGGKLGGYRNVELGGRHGWRVFVLPDEIGSRWVVVGERDDVRGEMVSSITLRGLVPDLIGLPLIALLVWLAVGWGLAPLQRMVSTIRSRDADNLAPMSMAPLPTELEPVIAALNRLLAQVDTVLEREKRFLADAAHELRTPLAVLRIQAQNAVDAADPEDRAHSLRALGGGVERATRVVEQLLTLARLEPGAAGMARTEHDLGVVVREELAELTPLALARHQELDYIADEQADLRLPCDAAGIGTLVRNLVGNAIRHAPEGGRVRVSLERAEGALRLSVEDDGAGVPEADRARLTERFCRLDEGGGAGLGLSIALRVVELHGGNLRFGASPLGGLGVDVDLPAGDATL